MSNSISLLSMNELIEQFKTFVKTKDYFVFETDRDGLMLKLNLHYRANYFGVILILEGTSKYNIHADDKEYIITKNDVLFCVPDQTFKIIEMTEDYKAIQIFFSADLISNSGFNYKSNDVLKSLSSGSHNIISQQLDLFNRLKFHIEELKYLNKFDTNLYYYNEMIWHHFSLLIYGIDNHFKETNAIQYSSREDEITTTFFTLVKEHFKEHHNVQFYADKLFITRKYLGKIIKKTMSKTPRDIINQVLLIEAKLLLRNSGSNVSEVTAILNFSDRATFSKFFKKHSGKTPSEYRKDDLF